MKITGSCCISHILFCFLTSNVYAGPPQDQVTDAAVYQQLQQMPFMQGMNDFQAKYDKIKEERQQERKAIQDKIYAEELEKARKQGSGNPMYDPYSASEAAAKRRLEPLYAQWKKDDQELEKQMQEDMMNSTGMGKMLKQQQEMTKRYGYQAPVKQ
jgi:hypothetical protein